MLRNTSTESIMTLAQSLAGNNVVVAPIPQSPLHEAVMACYSPVLEVGIVGDNGAEEYTIRNIIQRASETKALDGSFKHDDVIKSIVDTVARTVQQNIHIAKNVVNPVVKAVVDDVEAALHHAEIATTNQLGVLAVTYKPIWDSPVLEGMVEKYEDAENSNLRLNFVHKHLSPAELSELIQSASGRFNEEIAEWAKELPADFLENTYHDVFCSDNAMANHEDAVYLSPKIDGLHIDTDALLAIHFMARNLKAKVQDGINMDLADYRSYMIEVIEQTGRAICRVMERRVRDKKLKSLAIRWPVETPLAGSTGQVISVNADVYKNWLEEGGTPEVLMGSFLYDRETGYAELIERAEHYKAVWDRHAALLRSRSFSSRYNVTLQALASGVAKQINAMDESALPTTSRAALHAKLDECLGHLNKTRVEDIYGCARHLVCEVMFANTDAEEILTNIDDAVKANPDMNVREAALLAVVDVVVNWLFDNLSVKKEVTL